MNVQELRPALRAAGVDDSRYCVPGEPGWIELAKASAPDRLRLLRIDDQDWRVTGGQDVTFGFETDLRTLGSEAEACEVFYQEMTRPDGKPFEAEKAAWAVEFARRRRENEERVARDWPELGASRAYWQREWARREAVGEPGMTVPELVRSLDEIHRRTWRIVGVDNWSYGEEQEVAFLGPDGTWWLVYTGERGSGPSFVSVGLSEAEACKYMYDINTTVAATRKPTEAQWRAVIKARRWNSEGRPVPQWGRRVS